MSTHYDSGCSTTDFGDLDEGASDTRCDILAAELPELQRAVGVGSVISVKQQHQEGWCNGTALDKSLLHGGSVELSRLRFHIYVTLGAEARDVFDGIVLDQLRVAERVHGQQREDAPNATISMLERAPRGAVLH